MTKIMVQTSLSLINIYNDVFPRMSANTRYQSPRPMTPAREGHNADQQKTASQLPRSEWWLLAVTISHHYPAGGVPAFRKDSHPIRINITSPSPQPGFRRNSLFMYYILGKLSSQISALKRQILVFKMSRRSMKNALHF